MSRRKHPYSAAQKTTKVFIPTRCGANRWRLHEKERRTTYPSYLAAGWTVCLWSAFLVHVSYQAKYYSGDHLYTLPRHHEILLRRNNLGSTKSASQRATRATVRAMRAMRVMRAMSVSHLWVIPFFFNWSGRSSIIPPANIPHLEFYLRLSL